ncbi:hypothetical protein FC89_GL000481 [Liquorilactobacillus ghanensis DSM 18630]|uniref:Uncharacterized protein n=1 Tax=Liquorilactobacillus ghanensis DSM 18630 TaxID=1423750 RepID=A0A0R1VLS5_9LACO|nr:hypothetical protein FC89_GL000481 [Liquorilactobacillus ghanensis DSM 18630]
MCLTTHERWNKIVDITVIQKKYLVNLKKVLTWNNNVGIILNVVELQKLIVSSDVGN